MNKLWFTAMGAIVVTFSACASPPQSAPPPPPPQPEVVDPNAQSIDSGFLLSPIDKKDLQGRAESGDRDAAFRLSFHFLSAGDYEKAKKWQLFAAENGHPVAQYSQWFDLKDKRDCTSMGEALAWLEAAAKGGNKEAQDTLVEYRKAVDSCIP